MANLGKSITWLDILPDGKRSLSNTYIHPQDKDPFPIPIPFPSKSELVTLYKETVRVIVFDTENNYLLEWTKPWDTGRRVILFDDENICPFDWAKPWEMSSRIDEFMKALNAQTDRDSDSPDL